VSAGVASQLVTRFGFKLVLVAGFVLVAIGLMWFAQVSPAAGVGMASANCELRIEGIE
jgi:hypothetical protein